MRILTAITFFIGLTGCIGEPKDPTDDTGEVLDADADGIDDATDNCPEVPNDDQADLDGDGNGDVCDADVDGDSFEGAVDDCDDADAAINPDADELCDTIDNDCDGEIDEDGADGALTFYADTDADGYGDPAVEVTACAEPTGHVDNANDCNDADGTISPDGVEVCDGEDNNCDGEDDEDAATDAPTWYADVDLDTYGDQNTSMVSCYAATGYVANMDDCDDSDDTVGIIDLDADGYNSCTDDCDDSNAEAYPGAADLDSLTDCMADSDDDGWGHTDDGGTDCDDNDAAGNQDDADADGLTSCAGDCDDADALVGSVDTDGDGFSDCYVDCAPNDADTFPGAAPNDSATDCLTDADGDDYGKSSSCVTADLYDAGIWWSDAYLYVYENGTLIDSLYNMNGGTESYSICSSGQVVLEYICTSSYDCTNQNIAIYDEGGNELYNDGDLVTGNEPLQGEFLTVALGGGTDCDDADAAITATDVDGDGNIACIDDCDDDDATLNNNDDDGDGLDSCGIYTDIDCDDSDANIGATDVDADGYIACLDDCNDNDNTSYSIWDDGDCDGTATADDCDDDDATSHIVADDADCDGDLTATDCDDTDASLTSLDDDGDSVTSCNGDCDDSDAYTYPGAAYNESVTECLTDADGDGYAPTPDSCFDLDITDSFGDGWDGAFLSVYENGSWISDHTTSGANTVDQVCMSAASWTFTLDYTSGSYEWEHSYIVTGATSGTVYFSDGPSPATGTVLTVSSHGDSDDNDASVQ